MSFPIFLFQVVAIGFSAGGHLVASLAVNPIYIERERRERERDKYFYLYIDR